MILQGDTGRARDRRESFPARARSAPQPRSTQRSPPPSLHPSSDSSRLQSRTPKRGATVAPRSRASHTPAFHPRLSSMRSLRSRLQIEVWISATHQGVT
jgi:hypothetical protein